ncbi:hypothetical protein [Rubricoccus marinus]|uniref:hypothetical protein n=1 Tax=Rubricoccus marinus TaxID=716817 RepID=UPI00117BCA0D|nr:hypothetical protein [Rubricoccus marinus]
MPNSKLKNSILSFALSILCLGCDAYDGDARDRCIGATRISDRTVVPEEIVLQAGERVSYDLSRVFSHTGGRLLSYGAFISNASADVANAVVSGAEGHTMVVSALSPGEAIGDFGAQDECGTSKSVRFKVIVKINPQF